MANLLHMYRPMDRQMRYNGNLLTWKEVERVAVNINGDQLSDPVSHNLY